MKRTVRLRENELRRMVSESVKDVLNEAYGTPDTNTQQNVDYLRMTGMPKNDELAQAWSQVITSLSELRHCAKWFVDKPYGMTIDKTIEQFKNKMDSILRMRSKKLIQSYGEQPDRHYFDNHPFQL